MAAMLGLTHNIFPAWSFLAGRWPFVGPAAGRPPMIRRMTNDQRPEVVSRGLLQSAGAAAGLFARSRFAGFTRATPPRVIRAGLIVSVVAVVALIQSTDAAQSPDRERLATVKQWTAEVVVTSDCDRTAFDGSRTAIHNRIVTTYQFNRRVTDAPPSALTWRGKATTTYHWSVTLGGRDSREIEESDSTFELESELQLTDSMRISTMGRPPARPFKRTRYLGDAVVDTTTANDWPPSAELFDAALPSESGTLSGSRMEYAYSLFGGAVLNCPAQRQWVVRP
jgi:hypothetical protein